MREFFDSFSIGSGSVVIAVTSVVLALVTARLRPAALRWTAAILVPLALAYSFYWLPVWLGASRDQRWSWEPLFIGWWWLAGLFATSIITFAVSRHAKRNA